MSNKTATKKTATQVARAIAGKKYPRVLAAIAAGEAASWRLANAAAAEIAPGMETVSKAEREHFASVLAENGVTMSPTTIRLYRATARFWGKVRVDGFGFSAHHYARQGAETVAEAKAILDKASKLAADRGVAPSVTLIHEAAGKASTRTKAGRKASNGKAVPGKVEDSGKDIPAIDRLIAQALAITAEVLADADDKTLTRSLHALESAGKVVVHVQTMRADAKAKAKAETAEATKAGNAKAAKATGRAPAGVR